MGVEAELHPELLKRINYVLQDLQARGWDVRLSNGSRSLSKQILEKAAGRSAVSFSFHMVTDAAGHPQAMAVHVIDRKLGYRAAKGHLFWQDLETSAERHGLRTGNSWKKPWDPAHVQLYENSQLKDIRRGLHPPYLSPKLVLWAPRFSFRKIPTYLPPRSLGNLMAGERFYLALPDVFNASSGKPALGNFQLRPPAWDGLKN
jgi:hypothetical protein